MGYERLLSIAVDRKLTKRKRSSPQRRCSLERIQNGCNLDESFLNQTKYDSHGFRPEKPQFLDFRNGGGGNVSSVEFKQPLFNNP